VSDKVPDTTRAAVLAALMTGQGSADVAREYNIPEGTVRSWKQRYCNGVAQHATVKKEIASLPQPTLGKLIMDYLEANLSALKCQVIVLGW